MKKYFHSGAFSVIVSANSSTMDGMLARCEMEERQENLYSIGEAAEILGISVQTLRYYDKIKLLEPAYTNPNTGYRYYSYIQ